MLFSFLNLDGWIENSNGLKSHTSFETTMQESVIPVMIVTLILLHHVLRKRLNKPQSLTLKLATNFINWRQNLLQMELNHIRRVRQLYKIILKMHNGLPGHIKAIGNTYVKDEFRRHKNCKPQESSIFLEEWTKYAVVLAHQIGLKGPKSSKPLGKSLTIDQLDSMSDDQIQQLYQLMLATQGKTDEDFFKNNVNQNIT